MSCGVCCCRCLWHGSFTQCSEFFHHDLQSSCRRGHASSNWRLSSWNWPTLQKAESGLNCSKVVASVNFFFLLMEGVCRPLAGRGKLRYYSIIARTFSSSTTLSTKATDFAESEDCYWVPPRPLPREVLGFAVDWPLVASLLWMMILSLLVELSQDEAIIMETVNWGTFKLI